jgi:hypothetical protein
VRKQYDRIAVRRGVSGRFPHRHPPARNVDFGDRVRRRSGHHQESMEGEKSDKKSQNGEEDEYA